MKMLTASEALKMASRKRLTVIRIKNGIEQIMLGFDELMPKDIIRFGMDKDDARKRPLCRVITYPKWENNQKFAVGVGLGLQVDVLETGAELEVIAFPIEEVA